MEIHSYPRPFAPRLVFYRIIYCRELRASSPLRQPSSRVTTTNLGTKHTTTTNAALLLMDSSLMKYLDESARIYCAPARPALSRIVHDKPALISSRRSTGLSPKNHPLPRSAVIPIPFSARARDVDSARVFALAEERGGVLADKNDHFPANGQCCVIIMFFDEKKEREEKRVSIRNRYRRIYFSNYFRQIRLTVRVYSFDPF